MISMNKTCERCEEELSGKQVRWCSQRCSVLGLKSAYRKRHREKLYAYKNEYRRAKNGGNRPPRNPAKHRTDECLKCGSSEDLQGAHVKPLWAGGKHNTIITLCRKHHYQFDNLLRDFWKEIEAKNI